MSVIGALTKVGKAGETVKKASPFYSVVDETLANLKRNKGTGAEFLTEVMKTKGVKPAEIADRKLEQAFKDKGKMTKEEAQQILKENPPPKLQERELTEISDYEREQMLEAKLETSGYDYMGEVPPKRLRQWNEEIDEDLEKYSDYKTAGGQNYREMLLKLPKSDTSKADNNYWSTHFLQDANVLAHMRVQDRLVPQPPQKGFYVVNKTSGRQSQMFDTPEELQAYVQTLPENIRNNVTVAQGERKTPPKKILHVEEIQSDWHQTGRKKGYKPDDYIEQSNALEKEFKDLGERRTQLLKQAEDMPTHGVEFTSLMNEAIDITPKLMKLQEQRDDLKNVINYGVPDAPFKKNWHELAMKRLLNYAADNGYDSIAISPGAEQFRRYGSERIDWKKGDDGWTVGAKEQHGGDYGGQNIEDIARERGILLETGGDPVKSKEDLHRIVSIVMRRDNSKEQIDKLTDRVWNRMQTEPEGTSLPRKEGMEGFYDKMLTDYLNNYGDKYGAKVDMNSIPVSTRDPKSTSWGGGMRGDHPFITVQDLNEPFDGMVELMRRHPETGEETLVGRMTRPESERHMAEELQKLDTYNQIKLHNFPITPEMRESIKQKGLPLYQQVGIPTAGAGAASQMLEPEEEAGLATGGSVAKLAALAKMRKLKEEMTPRAEAVKSLIARDQNRYLADVAPNSLTNAEIQAEIARMAARAKASGQQEGVLPRAERDANLSKMLEGSAAKKRLYHATDKDIVSYDKSKLGTNPDTAHQTSQLGFFLTDSTDEATGYAGKRKGANIQPVYANIKNPYVTTWDNIHEADGSELQQKLKGLGYDGVLIKDKGMPDNYVAFEPTQIKSAIGNRGTYDINEPEVNKAKGGVVRMTKNRDAMFMELSNKKLKRK
jgi:ADP-Ribosyltransferase in polyvalent proteins